MGGELSKPKQLELARVAVISDAGEDEVHGLFVEMERPFVANNSGKPSFLYAGRVRNHAKIVLWWTDSGEQWNIGKFPRLKDVGATNKLWYIASASTGADVSGVLPPSTGWAVSAKASHRAYGSAAFTIDPAPTCLMMDCGEQRDEAFKLLAPLFLDMFKRGVKYAADGE
jgi:hypothetical protein